VSKQVTSSAAYCAAVSGVALMIALASPAIAQTGPAQAPAEPAPPTADGAPPASDAATPDIIVTGFRASLNAALNEKRTETAAIDSIVAEDIGKFPDTNLAESMQRIPGIALARGDGGEGKNISVRGLGAGFTRIRINGMEGTSQTGSSDIYGGGAVGRSFDFNVFPSEIFSQLSVRKTPSADVEEGSLGATVDLKAPKPFDSKQDFVFTVTGKGVYNTLAKKVNPRFSGLISKKFGDSGFGILASGAYQQRDIREVGYSAVDLLPSTVNGGFCSPIGVTPQNPATNAVKGTDAANCSTGNPRSGSVAAYNTIQSLTKNGGAPGSGAFFPRIPRYLNSQQDQKRIGGTVSLQFKPDEDTDISLDVLYSRFDVKRTDSYIEAISFGRSASNNGQPMTSVTDVQFDKNGSIVYGAFNGVDVRAESLYDHFVSTFKQANLNFYHRFTPNLEVSGLFGMNESLLDGKERLQTYMDAIDQKFTLDYRDGGSTPLLGYGFDVSNPNNFNYAPGRPDGTVLGGFSFQARPAKNRTTGLTGELNGIWTFSPVVKLKFGGQYRSSNYLATSLAPYTADLAVKALPAGTTLASITTQVSGVDKLWGNGAPASWAVIDHTAWEKAFNFAGVRYCDYTCGGVNSRVFEKESSAYAMTEFNLGDVIGWGIRGDAGVRYIKTEMHSSGYINVANAASPTGLAGQFRSAQKDYQDWLPSANVVIEPFHNLLLRLSGSKVLARPELGLLTPTNGATNAVTRTVTINNPLLDPIRANTFDAGLEWYYKPGGLLSAAFFYKDIKSFVQNVNSLEAFNTLGLPNALLNGSNTQPTELFTVSRPFNTPGGKLKGVEINAQVPLTFLPGFLHNLGVLGNFTHVTSKITYILASVNGIPTVTTTADLLGLSRNTASGTAYYEDSKFSIRGTANWRDRFIRGIPASTGSDLQGNAPTLYVDASASYNLNDHIKVIVEGQNLTNEQNNLYTDSVRQDTLFQTNIGRTISFGASYRF